MRIVRMGTTTLRVGGVAAALVVGAAAFFALETPTRPDEGQTGDGTAISYGSARSMA